LVHWQHSPEIGDGLEAFRASLSAPGRRVVYRDIFRIVAAGNFVVTYSRVAIGAEEFAVFDIYRLQNGLIVEHWDNREPIPSPEQARNRGKF
jgi:predicted SnoaL-like aldol condensation-catalyzing enzyme